MYKDLTATLAEPTTIDNCIVERERQKAEKLAKFNAKKAKQAAEKAAAPATGAPKEKEKKKEKPKAEPIEEYIEETPKGEKKGTIPLLNLCLRCCWRKVLMETSVSGQF